MQVCIYLYFIFFKLVIFGRDVTEYTHGKWDEAIKVLRWRERESHFIQRPHGSLRYLISTNLDILYAVGVVSQLMESPTSTYMKVPKRILCYLKVTFDYQLFYSFSNDYKLHRFCDSDYARDINDINRTSCFIYFMGGYSFSWSSKKQPIVTLSTYQSKYVAITWWVIIFFYSTTFSVPILMDVYCLIVYP